jgi:hypothetical protein
MAPSKKVRELFGPPTNASDKFPFEFPKPNPKMVEMAILTTCNTQMMSCESEDQLNAMDEK